MTGWFPTGDLRSRTTPGLSHPADRKSNHYRAGEIVDLWRSTGSTGPGLYARMHKAPWTWAWTLARSRCATDDHYVELRTTPSGKVQKIRPRMGP